MQKVRWGVIGAGGIARRKTIPGLRAATNSELVAVMDVQGVEAIAREFGVLACASEEDLLARSDIDAIYIASPVHAHLMQIEKAAAQGKHILCEKPLALNAQETERAVDACRAQGVFLQEGYMMKFHGAHATIRRLIEAKRLGRIVYMRAQLSCWYPPIPGAWRQDPALGGGGALMDMATHLYDLLISFAGPVESVTAVTGNLVQAYASEDASTTLLTFASGAQATVDCFFCIPDEASRTRLEIYGSAGSILSEGTIGQSTGGTLEGILGLGTGAYDASQNKDVARTFAAIDFPQVNPYTAECEYLADCILRKQAPSINNAQNALQVARLVDAAYQSSSEGRRVNLPV